MNIDSRSARDLFDYILSHGFSGTQDQWADAVQRAVLDSAVRDFSSYASAVCVDASLCPVFEEGCAIARAHFEHVHTSSGGRHAHISFTQRAAGAEKGRRITQLTVDVDRSRGFACVHVQGVSAGRLRLDRYFTVSPGEE